LKVSFPLRWYVFRPPFLGMPLKLWPDRLYLDGTQHRVGSNEPHHEPDSQQKYGD